MNKKGSIAMGLVVGITLFLVGLSALNLFFDDIDTARSGLDCTNSSISSGAKLNCLIADLTIPYMIIIVLSLVGGFITWGLS